jgi:site-specific recombinase XerD
LDNGCPKESINRSEEYGRARLTFVSQLGIRIERAYIDWVKRFILFHHKRHPASMGAPEIRAFLSYLAVEGKVAASTQTQALSALVFLYREVLHRSVASLGKVERAKKPERLPIVFSRAEVRAVLAHL